MSGANQLFGNGGGWGNCCRCRCALQLQLAFKDPCLPAAFNLDYYTEVLDLSYLVDHLASDPFFRNFRRLNEKLVEVIEDYSLVSFVPLNVQVTQQEGSGSLACVAAAFCLLRATAVRGLRAGKQGNTPRPVNDLWQPKERKRLMSLRLPGPRVLGWGIQAPPSFSSSGLHFKSGLRIT